MKGRVIRIKKFETVVEENSETLLSKEVTKLKQLDIEFYENHVSETGMYVNSQWMKSHLLYQSDSLKLTKIEDLEKPFLKKMRMIWTKLKMSQSLEEGKSVHSVIRITNRWQV